MRPVLTACLLSLALTAAAQAGAPRPGAPLASVQTADSACRPVADRPAVAPTGFSGAAPVRLAGYLSGEATPAPQACCKGQLNCPQYLATTVISRPRQMLKT